MKFIPRFDVRLVRDGRVATLEPTVIRHPSDTLPILEAELSELAYERFVALALNTKNHLTAVLPVSSGSLNAYFKLKAPDPGTISLTKTTALDVAGANIYVNAIACGGVLTAPFQDYLDRISDEQKNRFFQMVPLGRIGRPEEYASLAVYLASDEHYLVGQVISPNGGLAI